MTCSSTNESEEDDYDDSPWTRQDLEALAWETNAKNHDGCRIVMSLHSELEQLEPRELVEELSIRIYERPLSEARTRLLKIAEPLRVIILLLDFDTEVCMQGILGFLENSTGLFLAETVEAFRTIGASETVEVLRGIQKTLDKHGITPARLRADFNGSKQYQVTTFAEVHGDLGSLPDEIEQDADRLYLNVKNGEDIWSLLENYIAKRKSEILVEIARVVAEYDKSI